MTLSQVDLLTDRMLPLRWDHVSPRRFLLCHPVSGEHFGIVLRINERWWPYWRRSWDADWSHPDLRFRGFGSSTLAVECVMHEVRRLGFEVAA